MRKDNKWLLRVVFVTLIVSFALLLIKIPSYAANEIITAKNHVDVLVAPEEGADILVSFEKGNPIFVTGMKNGWYCVLYQGTTGYFCTTSSLTKGTTIDSETGDEESDVKISEIIAEDDEFEDNLAGDLIAEMDTEFVQGMEEEQFVVQETESVTRAKTNSIIWGVVIAVLVILLLVLSVISAKKNKKNTDENVEEETTTEEEPTTEEEATNEEASEIENVAEEEVSEESVEETVDEGESVEAEEVTEAAPTQEETVFEEIEIIDLDAEE